MQGCLNELLDPQLDELVLYDDDEQQQQQQKQRDSNNNHEKTAADNDENNKSGVDPSDAVSINNDDNNDDDDDDFGSLDEMRKNRQATDLEEVATNSAGREMQPETMGETPKGGTSTSTAAAAAAPSAASAPATTIVFVTPTKNNKNKDKNKALMAPNLTTCTASRSSTISTFTPPPLEGQDDMVAVNNIPTTTRTAVTDDSLEIATAISSFTTYHDATCFDDLVVCHSQDNTLHHILFLKEQEENHENGNTENDDVEKQLQQQHYMLSRSMTANQQVEAIYCVNIGDDNKGDDNDNDSAEEKMNRTMLWSSSADSSVAYLSECMGSTVMGSEQEEEEEEGEHENVNKKKDKKSKRNSSKTKMKTNKQKTTSLMSLDTTQRNKYICMVIAALLVIVVVVAAILVSQFQ